MEYAIELLQEQLRLLHDDIKSMLLTEEERRQTSLKLSHVVKALNKLMVKPTKPISELTKEDAIEIAKAALNDDSIDVVKGELKNKGDFYEILFSDKYWFIIHLNDGFECEHRDEYGESFRYYPAKATDKARELGYDV